MFDILLEGHAVIVRKMNCSMKQGMRNTRTKVPKAEIKVELPEIDFHLPENSRWFAVREF
jgi:hypothetical protein